MTDILRELGLEFTAEDFEIPTLYAQELLRAVIADHANTILREKLKGATRVYTNANEPRGMETTAAWSAGGPLSSHTHTGYLVGVTPITGREEEK